MWAGHWRSGEATVKTSFKIQIMKQLGERNRAECDMLSSFPLSQLVCVGQGEGGSLID